MNLLTRKLIPVLILPLFLLLLPVTSKAGGTSYLFEIIKMESKGTHQYKLTLRCREKEAVCSVTDQIVIHLRFNKAALGRNMPSQITLENYLACISNLEEQYKRGGSFRFGFMGTGIVPMPGRKNQYQSNALAEFEENDRRAVIYSFARPV